VFAAGGGRKVSVGQPHAVGFGIAHRCRRNGIVRAVPILAVPEIVHAGDDARGPGRSIQRIICPAVGIRSDRMHGRRVFGLQIEGCSTIKTLAWKRLSTEGNRARNAAQGNVDRGRDLRGIVRAIEGSGTACRGRSGAHPIRAAHIVLCTKYPVIARTASRFCDEREALDGFAARTVIGTRSRRSGRDGNARMNAAVGIRIEVRRSAAFGSRAIQVVIAQRIRCRMLGRSVLTSVDRAENPVIRDDRIVDGMRTARHRITSIDRTRIVVTAIDGRATRTRSGLAGLPR